MTERALKRNPSFEETANMLKTHLQSKHRLRKRSPVPPPKMTPSEVREEAAQILEAFLQRELEKHGTDYDPPVISSVYQRVEEDDITEEELPLETKSGKSSLQSSASCNVDQVYISPSGTSCTTSIHGISQNSAKTSLHSLLDVGEDIPFADCLDNGMRSHSLPPAYPESQKVDSTLKGSKSLSPSNLASVGRDSSTKNKKPVTQTTPKSASFGPAEADETYLPRERGRRRFKSGSESSCDSENEQNIFSEKRKKKSVFARVRERLSSTLSRSRERKPKDEEYSPTSTAKAENRRLRKKPTYQNSQNKGEMLQERHTHKHGHMEQHHYTSGDKSGVCFESETWETTDITDQEHGKQRHIGKHSKLKESKDASPSESSLIENIRRLASRKSKKKSVPESKSAEFSSPRKKSKAVYDRTISVPDGNYKGKFKVHDHRETYKAGGDNGRSATHTSHITTIRDADSCEEVDREQTILNGSRTQSSHPSPSKQGFFSRFSKSKKRSNGRRGTSEPDGRKSADSWEVSKGHEAQNALYLSRDKSFVVDYDIDETEFRKRLPTGELDVETKRHIHQRSHSKDIEVDGLDDPEDDFSSKKSEAVSKKDKERLYGVIAERLAEIGDNYASGSEGATASSPRRPSQNQVQGQDERDGDGLNSLERELRDTLRSLGDTFSHQNPVSPETTEVAKDIVRQATYETFTNSVKRAIGDEVGWDQLAMLFHVTKRAVKVAGFGGAVARQVKEMSLRYVEDKFASWIVDQGGFDSVLEDDSTDSELD